MDDGRQLELGRQFNAAHLAIMIGLHAPCCVALVCMSILGPVIIIGGQHSTDRETGQSILYIACKALALGAGLQAASCR